MTFQGEGDRQSVTKHFFAFENIAFKAFGKSSVL
jgi:hypothetical protein